MEFKGSVSLVTGGGRGIGASLVRALAKRGARGITIVDQDRSAAAQIAEDVGGIGIGADGTDPEAMARAVRMTEERFGSIDLLFSNVGIWVEGDAFAELSVWERVWRVNVMSHVIAVQAVLPGMLDRKKGHVAITASAAGLLSSIGSATYAVTRAGAVALAEWLAIEYGTSGVGVSCLCPLGVDTAMLRDSLSQRSRRATTQGAEILEADEVAESFIEGIMNGQFLVLPHQEAGQGAEHRRMASRDAAITGAHVRDR